MPWLPKINKARVRARSVGVAGTGAQHTSASACDCPRRLRKAAQQGQSAARKQHAEDPAGQALDACLQLNSGQLCYVQGGCKASVCGGAAQTNYLFYLKIIKEKRY